MTLFFNLNGWTIRVGTGASWRAIVASPMCVLLLCVGGNVCMELWSREAVRAVSGLDEKVLGACCRHFAE